MGQGSLALLDYRRRVASHYAQVRAAASEPAASWRRWRSDRDHLFKHHSESPLLEGDRTSFEALRYFEYNPALRFEVALRPMPEASPLEVSLDQDGPLSMQPLGQLSFTVTGSEVSLTAFWLEGYGGGLFLPFRDATNGNATYGGGRYLLDTIKGADLGSESGRLILDFNFAYNPSCAYNPQWHCPLAPTENWLEVEIAAGEKDYGAGAGQTPDPTAIPEPHG